MSDTGSRGLFVRDELAYCDLIAAIGQQQGACLPWWASTLAAKNFDVTDFWQRVQRFAAPNEAPLPAAARRWAVAGPACRQLYRAYLLAPPAMRRQATRLQRQVPPGPVVLVTHWLAHCFPPSGDYVDSYWQPLLDHCAAQGIACVLLGLHVVDEHAVVQAVTARDNRLGPAGTISFPLALFLTPADVWRAACWAATSRLALPAALPFRGKDLGPLLRHQYATEVANGDILVNLCCFLAFRRVIARLQPRRILWPWENLPWERMLIRAARQAAVPPRLVAYQHGALPPFLLNHFPGRGESRCAPMPDRLLTVGPETAELLQRYGDFPAGVVQPACALRHQQLQHLAPPAFPEPAGRPVGVALLAGGDTSARLMRLAIDGLADLGRPVWVRCHPLWPEAFVRRDWTGGLPPNFCFAPPQPVARFLAQVGCVVCSESSLGFEAVAAGVPYIYADLGHGPTGDPMFACDHLKFTAASPAALRAAVTAAEHLTPAAWREAWTLAHAYVRRYFRACTPERLAQFLEA